MRIAIVGGGPAGAYLGYCLAAKGIEATLFDDSHPREKPCGGGLSTFALRKFPILHELPSGKVEGNKIFLISPSGREAMIEGREKGWNVSRAKLDGFLLERATDEGTKLIKERVAAVKKGGGWEIKTNKHLYHADILVGADGVNSIVRKTLVGPIRKEDLGFCYGCFTSVSREMEDMEGIMQFLKGMMGYAWLFPRETDCSIGIGTDIEHVKRAKKELDIFVKKYAKNAKIISKWGALIPSARTPAFFRQPAAGNDWLLIGDAAGHVNPVTGEGIVYALWSASLASKALEEGDMALFDALWRKEYGFNMEAGVKARYAFYNPLVINSSVWLAQRSGGLSEFLYASINNEIPYNGFTKNLAKAMVRGFIEGVL